jgi:hypothetical protein
MVLARKKPKLYTVTVRGLQTATMLKEICGLADQMSTITSRLAKDVHANQPQIDNDSKLGSRRDNVAIPITVIGYAKLNCPKAK